MRKLWKRISTRNRILLAALVLTIVSVALVFLLTSPWKGKEEAEYLETAPEATQGTLTPVNHSRWVKPGSMEIDWDRIRALSQYEFALNAEGGDANVPVRGEFKVEIDPADIQEIPKTLDVYKYVPLVQSEEGFKQIASRFGLKGEMKEGYIAMEENGRTLSYDAGDDTLHYYDREASKYPMDIPDVPSEEECKEIAMDIATETGLLPPGGKVIATNKESGTNPETGNQMNVTKRGIVIGVDIDGYRVRGHGMELRMDIGTEGLLCSICDNLRRLEYYGTFPVKPIEQALEEARTGKDTVNLEVDLENQTVTAFDFFYFSDNSYRKNGLLMPVYAFMGSDCCIYVPAVNQ